MIALDQTFSINQLDRKAVNDYEFKNTKLNNLINDSSLNKSEDVIVEDGELENNNLLEKILLKKMNSEGLFFNFYYNLISENIILKPFYLLLIIFEYLQLYTFFIPYTTLTYKTDGESVFNSLIYYYQLISFQWLLRNNNESSYTVDYHNTSNYTTAQLLNIDKTMIFYFFFVLAFIVILLVIILIGDINSKKKNTDHDYSNNSSNNVTVNKNYIGSLFYSIVGVFILLNIKILVIPIYYILFNGFRMQSILNLDVESSTYTPYFSKSFYSIVVKLLSSFFLVLYTILLFSSSILFNQFNHMTSNVCWAHYDLRSEFIKLILKIIVVFSVVVSNDSFNFLILFINIIFTFFISYFTYNDIFYYWKLYKSISIIFEISYFTTSVMNLIFEFRYQYFQNFFSIALVSILFGIIACAVDLYRQNDVILKQIKDFDSENEYCELITYLIQLIRDVSYGSKSDSKSYQLLGYLTNHIYTCPKKEHCQIYSFKTLLSKGKTLFKYNNEIIEISKSEINLFRNSSSSDSSEILSESKRLKCEKFFYLLIFCILDTAYSTLRTKKSGLGNISSVFIDLFTNNDENNIELLPLIEVNLSIYLNPINFFSLFQIMKQYNSNRFGYRLKFYYYYTTKYVYHKIESAINSNNTNNISKIITSIDFYFYCDIFIRTINSILNNGNDLFLKIINMKPSSQDMLRSSNTIGENIVKLHFIYLQIAKINPLEVNILRVYLFIIENLFYITQYSKKLRFILRQNIKSYFNNDRFKNNSDNLNFSFNEKKNFYIKNFNDNSDSGVLLVSGGLNSLGKILYCNSITAGLMNYDVKDLKGFSINTFIPEPFNSYHQQAITEFYKTGIKRKIDLVKPNLILSQKKYLENFDFYITYMPDLEIGVIFNCMMKASYKYTVVVEKNEVNNLNNNDNTEENIHSNVFSLNKGKVFNITDGNDSYKTFNKMKTGINSNNSNNLKSNKLNIDYIIKNNNNNVNRSFGSSINKDKDSNNNEDLKKSSLKKTTNMNMYLDDEKSSIKRNKSSNNTNTTKNTQNNNKKSQKTVNSILNNNNNNKSNNVNNLNIKKQFIADKPNSNNKSLKRLKTKIIVTSNSITKLNSINNNNTTNATKSGSNKNLHLIFPKSSYSPIKTSDNKQMNLILSPNIDNNNRKESSHSNNNILNEITDTNPINFATNHNSKLGILNSLLKQHNEEENKQAQNKSVLEGINTINNNTQENSGLNLTKQYLNQLKKDKIISPTNTIHIDFRDSGLILLSSNMSIYSLNKLAADIFEVPSHKIKFLKNRSLKNFIRNYDEIKQDLSKGYKEKIIVNSKNLKRVKDDISNNNRSVSFCKSANRQSSNKTRLKSNNNSNATSNIGSNIQTNNNSISFDDYPSATNISVSVKSKKLKRSKTKVGNNKNINSAGSATNNNINNNRNVRNKEKHFDYKYNLPVEYFTYEVELFKVKLYSMTKCNVFILKIFDNKHYKAKKTKTIDFYNSYDTSFYQNEDESKFNDEGNSSNNVSKLDIRKSGANSKVHSNNTSNINIEKINPSTNFKIPENIVFANNGTQDFYNNENNDVENLPLINNYNNLFMYNEQHHKSKEEIDYIIDNTQDTSKNNNLNEEEVKLDMIREQLQNNSFARISFLSLLMSCFIFLITLSMCLVLYFINTIKTEYLLTNFTNEINYKVLYSRELYIINNLFSLLKAKTIPFNNANQFIPLLENQIDIDIEDVNLYSYSLFELINSKYLDSKVSEYFEIDYLTLIDYSYDCSNESKNYNFNLAISKLAFVVERIVGHKHLNFSINDILYNKCIVDLHAGKYMEQNTSTFDPDTFSRRLNEFNRRKEIQETTYNKDIYIDNENEERKFMSFIKENRHFYKSSQNNSDFNKKRNMQSFEDEKVEDLLTLYSFIIGNFLSNYQQIQSNTITELQITTTGMYHDYITFNRSLCYAFIGISIFFVPTIFNSLNQKEREKSKYLRFLSIFSNKELQVKNIKFTAFIKLLKNYNKSNNDILLKKEEVENNSDEILLNIKYFYNQFKEEPVDFNNRYEKLLLENNNKIKTNKSNNESIAKKSSINKRNNKSALLGKWEERRKHQLHKSNNNLINSNNVLDSNNINNSKNLLNSKSMSKTSLEGIKINLDLVRRKDMRRMSNSQATAFSGSLLNINNANQYNNFLQINNDRKHSVILRNMNQIKSNNNLSTNNSNNFNSNINNNKQFVNEINSKNRNNLFKTHNLSNRNLANANTNKQNNSNNDYKINRTSNQIGNEKYESMVNMNKSNKQLLTNNIIKGYSINNANSNLNNANLKNITNHGILNNLNIINNSRNKILSKNNLPSITNKGSKNDFNFFSQRSNSHSNLRSKQTSKSITTFTRDKEAHLTAISELKNSYNKSNQDKIMSINNSYINNHDNLNLTPLRNNKENKFQFLSNRNPSLSNAYKSSSETVSTYNNPKKVTSNFQGNLLKMNKKTDKSSNSKKNSDIIESKNESEDVKTSLNDSSKKSQSNKENKNKDYNYEKSNDIDINKNNNSKKLITMKDDFPIIDLKNVNEESKKDTIIKNNQISENHNNNNFQENEIDNNNLYLQEIYLNNLNNFDEFSNNSEEINKEVLIPKTIHNMSNFYFKNSLVKKTLTFLIIFLILIIYYINVFLQYTYLTDSTYQLVKSLRLLFYYENLTIETMTEYNSLLLSNFNETNLNDKTSAEYVELSDKIAFLKYKFDSLSDFNKLMNYELTEIKSKLFFHSNLFDLMDSYNSESLCDNAIFQLPYLLLFDCNKETIRYGLSNSMSKLSKFLVSKFEYCISNKDKRIESCFNNSKLTIETLVISFLHRQLHSSMFYTTYTDLLKFVDYLNYFKNISFGLYIVMFFIIGFIYYFVHIPKANNEINNYYRVSMFFEKKYFAQIIKSN